MNNTYTGCGFSIENPFCFTSVEEEITFVDALRSPDGTRFIQDVKFSCKNKKGELVDHFVGYYLDSNERKVEFSFYANRYCSRVLAQLPDGWSIYIPEKNNKKDSRGISMTNKSETFSQKLHAIKTTEEFDKLYNTVPNNSIRDLLAALANGYNHQDAHMTWLFGLFELKQYNPRAAYHMFKRAAASGLSCAKLSLAELFHHTEPLGLIEKIKTFFASLTGQYHKNNESALYWIKQAIAEGFLPAEKVLETWYLEGIIPGDCVEHAASIYLPKAQMGDSSYMLKVSEVYRGRATFYSITEHHKNLTDRDNKAAAWRKRAADAGNIDAQVLMGDAYHFGWNVDADQKQSLDWYRTAADNGSRVGLLKLIDKLEDNGKMPGLYSWSRIIDKNKDLETINNYLSYYKQASKEGSYRAAQTLLYFINQGYSFPYVDEEVQLWKSVTEVNK